MVLQESGEMYLETILILSSKNSFVRAIDVGEYMGFSKPSVSVAMKNLRENGYISMDPDGYIKLEAPGMEIAQRIYERHNVLTKMFVALGVDEETAAQDACKIEHSPSDTTFNAIKNHVKNQAKA